MGIGPGTDLAISDDSGTGTVGRFNKEGCAMAFGALTLDVVDTIVVVSVDPDTNVFAVGVVDATVFCTVTAWITGLT
jgi:hypothetical protein